jgi:hypothetical protein
MARMCCVYAGFSTVAMMFTVRDVNAAHIPQTEQSHLFTTTLITSHKHLSSPLTDFLLPTVLSQYRVSFSLTLVSIQADPESKQFPTEFDRLSYTQICEMRSNDVLLYINVPKYPRTLLSFF